MIVIVGWCLPDDESGKNVSAAAQACGRTVQGAYKALNRIRKVLFDCVSFELTAEQTQAR